MQVSVVVPTRNRPLKLGAALRAIARQTYTRVELIIVDDGSEEGAAAANAALLATIAAGRIADPDWQSRYLFLESGLSGGSGPSAARNAGLRVAKGDLIAFCDDDDEWCDERHIEAAVAEFDRSKGVDLLFGNQHTLIDGRLVSELWLPLLCQRLGLSAPADGALYPLSKANCLIDHFPSMNLCVFRRTLLDLIGGFWEGVRYSEDMDLYVRAVESARGVVYRHKTVCLHHVADPVQKASASTRLSLAEKDLALTAVGNHLLQTCRSRDAHRYARRVVGFAYRRLARAALEAGNLRGALGLARLGLAAWPTARWAAFTAWIGLRCVARPKVS
jgi:glycosyltransferase involved in cell wall biosynthesis